MKPLTPPTKKGMSTAVSDIHHKTADVCPSHRRSSAKQMKRSARQHDKKVATLGEVADGVETDFTGLLLNPFDPSSWKTPHKMPEEFNTTMNDQFMTTADPLDEVEADDDFMVDDATDDDE